jgi:hypothetical protein
MSPQHSPSHAFPLSYIPLAQQDLPPNHDLEAAGHLDLEPRRPWWAFHRSASDPTPEYKFTLLGRLCVTMMVFILYGVALFVASRVVGVGEKLFAAGAVITMVSIESCGDEGNTTDFVYRLCSSCLWWSWS